MPSQDSSRQNQGNQHPLHTFNQHQQQQQQLQQQQKTYMSTQLPPQDQYIPDRQHSSNNFNQASKIYTSSSSELLDNNQYPTQHQQQQSQYKIQSSFQEAQHQDANHVHYLLQEQRRNIPAASISLPFPSNIDINQYPDMTTLVNSNENIIVPLVENRFVDLKVCTICGKRITRDKQRHMRTHQSESRFSCKFPKTQCHHKSGKFNRPYDFKKHLLNRHFIFDDPKIKKLHNLSDKLDHLGTCSCGLRFIGRIWLEDHILTDDIYNQCSLIKQEAQNS
ncbi:unnamed protein product [Candida verbasci]|uniref:Uncharacterized protein n=1 Tax=Candida verbasci TaxID=1227364 RepID=A0A9W4U1S6_9ASCO|nr:unnamed protein product [Candida verbasci]